MSETESKHFQEMLTLWWGQKSIKFFSITLGATVTCIGAVSASTWKVSSELHKIHLAIERNGNGDAVLRADMARIESRITALEMRYVKKPTP